VTDQDLAGDDAKSVSYWITFIKPDLVATLQDMQTDIINYATDAGSYCGLTIAEYLQRLAARKASLPGEWKDLSLPPGYATDEGKSLLLDIPQNDRKYIKVNYRIDWRQAVSEAERETEKVEALREIRDALRPPPTP
jgi:hypothetical protein